MASGGEFVCIDCKQSVNTKNDLECKKHTVCQECLVKRVLSQSQNITVCMECRKSKKPDSYKDALLSVSTIVKKETEVQPKTGTAFDSTLPGIWIFVDDSNIWIEAKKFQSKKRSFKIDQDHRVRIDTGKLADLIADGRPVQQGRLYGSEPPPVDTVWEKIRQKGWKVYSQHRSMITGKEKQIDTRLVADVTEIAISTPVDERSTIALVSGDADVIPALEKTISKEHWKIEMYMWKQGAAGSLKKFASKHEDRVIIKYHDNFLHDAIFTNMKFPINRKLYDVVKECGVVFSMTKNAFGNRVPDKAWCNQLESIAQWPFQYYWFKWKDETSNNLVVVFSRGFDISGFLDTIETSDSDSNGKYHLPKVNSVKPYLEFHQEVFKEKPDEAVQQFDAALEQVGMYGPDDVYAGYENEHNWVSDSEEKWSAIHFRKKQNQKYSDPCPFKFNCYNGTRCYYKHSDEEKAYFKRNKDGRGNPVRKTEICQYYNLDQINKCTKTPSQCEFAHGMEDAWCIQCRTVGHFKKDCIKP